MKSKHTFNTNMTTACLIHTGSAFVALVVNREVYFYAFHSILQRCKVSDYASHDSNFAEFPINEGDAALFERTSFFVRDCQRRSELIGRVLDGKLFIKKLQATEVTLSEFPVPINTRIVLELEDGPKYDLRLIDPKIYTDNSVLFPSHTLFIQKFRYAEKFAGENFFDLLRTVQHRPLQRHCFAVCTREGCIGAKIGDSFYSKSLIQRRSFYRDNQKALGFKVGVLLEEKIHIEEITENKALYPDDQYISCVNMVNLAKNILGVCFRDDQTIYCPEMFLRRAVIIPEAGRLYSRFRIIGERETFHAKFNSGQTFYKELIRRYNPRLRTPIPLDNFVFSNYRCWGIYEGLPEFYLDADRFDIFTRDEWDELIGCDSTGEIFTPEVLSVCFYPENRVVRALSEIIIPDLARLILQLTYDKFYDTYLTELYNNPETEEERVESCKIRKNLAKMRSTMRKLS
jgi:hypothetical protein